MSDIEAISALTGNSRSNNAQQSRVSFGDDFDDFLTLLTTQLQNQDPLEPTDTTEFTNQLVLFAGVEQDISQNDNLEQLIGLESANQAVGALNYIGNEVDSNWTGWFEAASPSGPVSNSVLEGALDLRAQFGSVPATIALAALAYGTSNEDPLVPSLQVPSGNGNTDVEASEYLVVDLSTIEITQCAADLTNDGVLDFFDLSMFLSEQPDWDSSTNFDFFDLSAFLTEFGSGCP